MADKRKIASNVTHQGGTLIFICIISIVILLGVPCQTTDTGLDVEDLQCCEALVNNAACQQSCEELSVGSPPVVQLRQLTGVARACPNTLTQFWQCINNTFPVVSGSPERWSGKTCCDLTLQPQCQHSCRRAKSRSDLHHCRPNEEVTFFQCLDRQEVSAQCCGPATSSQCRATCKSLFWASSPSTTDVENVREFCPPSIVSCVQNFTHTMFISPEEAVPCCQYSQSESCRQVCRQAMMSDLKDEEKYDLVISECEEAALGTDMWNCLLLLSAKSQKVQYTHGGFIGLDNAKLQCCTRALTNKCQQLCAKTYSNGWDRYISSFLEECVNTVREVALSECIREVDQPCQMGCSGMSYCTNFNHRPMELFQSCTQESDAGAQKAVQMWASGTIVLPNLIDQFLPIKDIRTCRPEAWQAIACTLYIKPCQTRAPASQICRADCMSILSECMDTARLPPGVTANTFCNMLSPSDLSKPCMSMESYLVESPYSTSISEITTPCNPNPCTEEEICLLKRRKCKHPGDPDCKQYQCRKACQMGEISPVLVPHKTFVRISEVSHEEANLQCYQGCKCGHNNQILNCKEMGCVEPAQCLFRSGRIQDHNTQFMVGCNLCSCYGGEMVCTQKSCLSSRATEEDLHAYTGLPCNCGNQYSPVCAENGQTLPSECLAQCLGFTDKYTSGTCLTVNPCQDDPCEDDEQCIPRRDVCISSKSHCKQYECVRISGECNRHSHQVACDTTEEEFSNVCTLLQRGHVFSHWGHCQDTCKLSTRVCGMDGVTYENECAAWADSIYVDYYGECHSVGQLLNLKSGEPSCASVLCPALPLSVNCRPITAPGTCCPKCIGEIRILLSSDRTREVAQVTQSNQIMIRDVVDIFRQHISVLECDTFGYRSVEGDLVMVIAPVTAHPTTLQMQACMSEAEKIGSLISSRSPIIMMHLTTSVFMSASTRTSYVYLSSGAAPCPTYTPIIILIVLVISNISHHLSCR